jgi:Uma2 family endonuclease
MASAVFEVQTMRVNRKKVHPPFLFSGDILTAATSLDFLQAIRHPGKHCFSHGLHTSAVGFSFWNGYNLLMPAETAILPPRATYTNEPIYQLSVDQYHDLINRGKLTPDDPVELIEGVLAFKMPKDKPHKAVVRRCSKAIRRVLPENYFYDPEQPLTLSDGEPEPDGMVVSGKVEDYDDLDVEPSHVALVIEVADTTLSSDRSAKLRSYARAGIPCYWIVNLLDWQIEAYTNPRSAAKKTPSYMASQIFKRGDSVPLLLAGQTIAYIPVSEILPNQ